MSAPVLRADALSVAGRLAEVSLALRAGELTAIVGPNGAGKSTLVACLAGLLAPSAGRITLDDARLDTMPARRRARLIGYLPQSPDVAWDVAVETLVGLGRLPWQGAPLHRARASAAEDAAAIEAALAAMELGDLRRRPMSRLSGGERARALAARVLAGEPRWLVADEPLANLDLAHAAALLARFKAEARKGTGIVVVLHDLAAAMNHADRVIVLNRGKVVADGPPREALDEATIGKTWNIRAQWLGGAGKSALAIQ